MIPGGSTATAPTTVHLMKTSFLAAALVTIVLPLGVRLEAGEDFTLETHIYVYRNSDFHVVKLPAATATDATPAMVFRSPAVAQFDEEKLSLDGPRFAWSGGRSPPDRFSLIAAPTVPLTPGKPVTLLSTAPIQYLERPANGILQVREIAGDSPEAPHCRLTFTIGPPNGAGKDLHLACDLDIATVVARQDVPGVVLDVGKPVLAQLKEKLDPMVRLDEWSAFHLQAPNRSDYSLLVLLKVVAAQAPGAVANAEQAGGLMTAEALDKFATYYYRNPRPELVAPAIEALGPSGFSKDRADVFVGFFAEVFAANPSRMAEWRELIDRQDRPTRKLLGRAVKFSRSGDLLSSDGHSIALNDMWWGAFFASGNPAYLRKLIDQLAVIHWAQIVDEQYRKRLLVAITAMWSLARNAPEHLLVPVTLEAVRTDADPLSRKMIDRLLAGDAEAVRQELLAHLDSIPSLLESKPNQSSTPNRDVWIGGHGPREAGDYGPMNQEQAERMRR